MTNRSFSMNTTKPNWLCPTKTSKIVVPAVADSVVASVSERPARPKIYLSVYALSVFLPEFQELRREHYFLREKSHIIVVVR